MTFELIFHNGLFCHFDLNEVIKIPNHRNYTNAARTDQKELQAKSPISTTSQYTPRIELILVEINRAKVERGDEIWKPDALFLKFL